MECCISLASHSIQFQSCALCCNYEHALALMINLISNLVDLPLPLTLFAFIYWIKRNPKHWMYVLYIIGRNVNSMLSIVLSCVIRVLNRIICLITGSAPVHTSSYVLFSVFFSSHHSLGLLVCAQNSVCFVNVSVCACVSILFSVYFFFTISWHWVLSLREQYISKQ